VDELRDLQIAARRVDVELDDAAAGRMLRFVDLLEIWNQRVRLTGDRDRRTILEKHVVDSLAPCRWLSHAGLVVDIGSGGGFPGVVVACVRPEMSVVLIEARRRPCSFLSEVTRAVPLPLVRVVNARAEEAATDATLAGRADVVMSRAVRLEDVLGLGRPFLASGGGVIAMRTPAGIAEEDGILAKAGFVRSDEFAYELPDRSRRRIVRLDRR
jgi:16S rRNA (guanine527-N7)-methyltransferase